MRISSLPAPAVVSLLSCSFCLFEGFWFTSTACFHFRVYPLQAAFVSCSLSLPLAAAAPQSLGLRWPVPHRGLVRCGRCRVRAGAGSVSPPHHQGERRVTGRVGCRSWCGWFGYFIYLFKRNASCFSASASARQGRCPVGSRAPPLGPGGAAPGRATTAPSALRAPPRPFNLAGARVLIDVAARPMAEGRSRLPVGWASRSRAARAACWPRCVFHFRR